MAVYHLSAPLAEDDVTKLRVGDVVYLSGGAFTCRSRLHRWVFDDGHPFPAGAAGRNVLIHVGPIVQKRADGWKLISFMPTSSIRFEKWGARSVDSWGLRMIVGKTTMGPGTMEMMARKKCVHVSPQCVAPNLWIDSIRVDGVDLLGELGSIEAAWHMTLSDLGPFVVDIDCGGGSLYGAREAEVDLNKRKALAELGIGEDFRYTKLY